MRGVRGGLGMGIWSLVASVSLLAGNASANEPLRPDPLDRPARLIINWDEQSLWRSQLTMLQRANKPLTAEVVRSVLVEAADAHARAGIDRMVYCCWARFESPSPGFRTAPYESRIREISPGFGPLHDSGQEQIQILMDRCHRHGMQFLLCLRMNDRHGIARKAKFYLEHPELRLDGYPGGLDYKHEKVRSKVLAFIAEALERYNVDGIELDYLRWCHVFEPQDATKNAHLLTDMTRKARRLIDAAAKKRGRKKLLLTVRVPQTLAECRKLGFDIKTWIGEGLVDAVCPSDFFFADFNIAVEKYVALCRGTNCKVYPTIHPMIQVNHPDNIEPQHYRALARGFYRSGAAGVSTYNYQYNWRRWTGGTRGLVDGWPRTLGWLTELKNPPGLEPKSRQYLFYPLWQIFSESGAVKYQRILMARSEAGKVETIMVRIHETNPQPQRDLVMRCKVLGLDAGENISLSINGHTIPAESIRRQHDKDGQSPQEGRPCGPFTMYEFPLKHEWLKEGDNVLGGQITRQAGGKKDVVAKDFELDVRPRT